MTNPEREPLPAGGLEYQASPASERTNVETAT